MEAYKNDELQGFRCIIVLQCCSLSTLVGEVGGWSVESQHVRLAKRRE